MRKIDWIIIFFIIFASVFSLKDLFKPNFYTSHDGTHQVARLYYFDQALKDGQIPPRWAGGLLSGFGYPLFIFSYQLPWFIAEPIHLAGASFTDSIELTFLIGFIFSGIFMYIFQKEMFGRLAAFAGTMLYLYAPYRFSNIFVRAALGDATSFIFPPILFLSLYKLKKGATISWVWITLGAVALAGILLSHAMVFLFFLMSLVIYFIYTLLFINKKFQFIVSNLLIVVLGIGVSSYYFIPSIIERDFTKFYDTMKPLFVGLSFLNFRELIYSPWGYGLMHSKDGGAMSFQLGIPQWITALLFLILVPKLILSKKNTLKEGLIDSYFYFFLFVATILLMLPISLPIWKKISIVALIDFTWRVLPVTLFAVSVLAGFVVKNIKFPYLAATFLILLSFYSNRNHLKINKTLDWPLGLYLSSEYTTNSYDEYTPKWVWPKFVTQKKPKVEFTREPANIVIGKNQSNYLDFNIETEQSGNIIINTIYYPGWKVYVDGKDIKISSNKIGIMEFPIDIGKHRVIARFGETPLRNQSNLLSLISMMVLLIGLLKIRKI